LFRAQQIADCPHRDIQIQGRLLFSPQSGFRRPFGVAWVCHFYIPLLEIKPFLQICKIHGTERIARILPSEKQSANMGSRLLVGAGAHKIPKPGILGKTLGFWGAFSGGYPAGAGWGPKPGPLAKPFGKILGKNLSLFFSESDFGEVLRGAVSSAICKRSDAA
jgi:hypothetical protein